MNRAAQPDGAHPKEEDKGHRPLQIHSLIERVSLINRIHTALRYTLNVEDIHSIILTTIISESGLDFSRGILLGYDETHGVFNGLAALGAADRDQHARLQREVAKEEESLANMVKDLTQLEYNKGEETFFNRSLRDLSNHSFWITILQKFSGGNDMFSAARRIEIPYGPGGAETSGGAVRPACQFMKELLASESARIVPHRAIENSDLPPALTEMLTSDSLWAPISTQKGIRLILIADKVFHAEPLSALDVVHVDWFVGQVALALENAEIYKDLELAYKSLRDLDRMKSNFLATISHELRTPLTAINGYAQLLMGNKIGPLLPGQKEVMERIHAHSDLLTGKVNDLIEIAELDSGRGYAPLEPVDPLGAVMNILHRVGTRQTSKGITVEPVVTGLVPKVRSNREAMERIFFHLVDNAIKFGHPHGHVWIEFETVGADLHIKIRDNGIGISQNQLQNIFDTFYQVDNQLTRSYEGLGIGLAVIKKQLDLTEGRIQVHSTPGLGSTFTVIYPLAHETTGADLANYADPI